jgi:outer membrane protein assembly factor BamB
MGITRRAALLLPLGLSACGIDSLDDLFSPVKPPIKGKREAVSPVRRGLEIQGKGSAATVPPVRLVADWPQAGGNAAHVPGHAPVKALTQVWTAQLDVGTDYRHRITSPPVVSGGRVIAMDADGVVSAFELATGRSLWTTATRPKGDRSTNVGGGVAASGSRVWAATGRGEMLALDAETGKIAWRKPLGAPARSAPAVADGRLYVTTLEEKLVALAADTGAQAWSYQAATVQTTLLGDCSPAVADGFVVAGFGSGDLVSLRADTGALAWSDSLAGAHAETSLLDLSAIDASPVIDQGRVYAIGDGGLFVCDDLRSGRRLWEREVGGSQMPMLAGDSIFVVTQEQVLAALNAQDGQPLWIVELERYRDQQKQSGPVHWVGPLLAGDGLIVGSSDRQLAAFSPARGRLIGSLRVPAAISLRPIAAGGFAIVLDDSGTIRAYR